MANSENTTRPREFLETTMKMRHVIGGGSFLVCSAVAATFAITQLALTHRADSSPPVPGHANDQPKSSADIAALTNRIAELEDEKSKIVSQIARASLDSLNPQSELLNLVQQLQDKNEEKRKAAAVGLIALKDGRAAAPLASYFMSFPAESKAIYTSPANLRTIWKSDLNVGAEFLLSLLGTEDDFVSNQAFEFLKDRAWSKTDEFEQIVPGLQKISLTNDRTLVRTRAKLLLREREDARRQRSENANSSESTKDGINK